MEKHADFDFKEYYKNLHLSRDILFLYANRLLIQISIGLLSVFTAVFFFEKFNYQFAPVVLIFAALYGFFVFLTPLSAMLINKVGIKRMLIIAVAFLPLSILSLVIWDYNPVLSLSMYIVFTLIYRVLYWTPYHIDFAKFTDKKDRGRQMSLLLNISEIFITIMPILAGFIIAYYGFINLFFFASIFLAVSIIPLFFISETREMYSFGYVETFKKLFAKENRPMLVAYTGDGVQTGVRIVIWPLFIFTLLSNDYISIGIVTSLTIFLLIAVRFIIGSLEDRVDRRKLLRFGSFMSTTGWIMKVFIETGFQIFIVDTYHKLGRVVNRMTFDITTYDQAADNGHYIDEFTVLKEIALNAGRAGMLLFSILLITLFGITSTFLFAAAATMLMSMISKDVYLQ